MICERYKVNTHSSQKFMIRHSTMKRALLSITCILFLCPFFTKAQDTLKLKDGSTQIVKVMEVSEITIKYKKFDNLKGPSYLIPVDQVRMIIYSSGAKEVMNKNTASANPNSQQNTGTELPTYTGRSSRRSQAVKKPYKKSGPRVGCTYVGEGSSSQWINDIGKVPFISQLGWEIEARIFSTESGIAAMAECYFLMGGMEQGLFLPTGALLIALRESEGREFAIGPNFAYYDKFILGM